MSTVGFREIQRGLRDLGLTNSSRVLALASLPAFGEVKGGAEAVAGALMAQCGLVLSPAFTPACQVMPLVGPPDNAMDYGDHLAENEEAEIFRPDLPVEGSLGPVAEVLRTRPEALRSRHPLLSFVAVGAGAEKLLLAQSLAEPLGPIERLAEDGGDLLLLGASHTANLALHYAEYRAGRKQFVRWALTAEGVVECFGWPGCSRGFDAIAGRLRNMARVRQIGPACVQRLPLLEVLRAAEDLLRAEPAALLCADPACACCNAVRAAIKVQAGFSDTAE
jgi:aminoglycoside 3-N-acetyltransferase